MSLFIIAAVAQAAIFQVYYLLAKSLQEKGHSTLSVLYYQRLAVIPGGLLVLATFRSEYISYLLGHPLVLAAILFCSAVWVVHTYLRIYVIDATNSMSFFNAFSAVISLPLLLLAGVIINHDLPSGLMLIALVLLCIGLMLQPGVHEQNLQKKALAIGVVLAIALTLLGQGIDAVNAAAYRYFFEHFSAVVFGASLFIFLSAFVINVIFWVRPPEEYRTQKPPLDWRGYALPVLFTIATLFEAYSITGISIYALVAIGSFTFLISAAGDLYSHRITFSFRTLLFIILISLGTAFAALGAG
jgi:drug/metabolite transporter (DMT)-like permease